VRLPKRYVPGAMSRFTMNVPAPKRVMLLVMRARFDDQRPHRLVVNPLSLRRSVTTTGPTALSFARIELTVPENDFNRAQ
jgi:hypothetical protein